MAGRGGSGQNRPSCGFFVGPLHLFVAAASVRLSRVTVVAPSIFIASAFVLLYAVAPLLPFDRLTKL